jgi:hypothetical protein
VRRFLFEDKEYRYRPVFKRRREGPDSAQALARLLNRKGPRRPAHSGGGQKKADLRQKCVVKAQYSNSIEAHRVQLEKYLVREGTDRNGERAALYGTGLGEYRNNMVEKNFRVFLSPQSGKTDLTALAERFVKKLELQTGYKLYWQAANHYNTAHPHAHLLINGRDKNGRDVVFPRDIVKTFMRETARDLCTAQLGTRTKADLAVEREKEIEAARFTKLDGMIKELCGGGFRPNLAGAGKDRGRVLARLEYLRRVKLCVYEGGGYKLAARWEADLTANGRYNAFLKAREGLQYTQASRLRVYAGEAGAVTGRVTKIYRTDGDASDNHAVVLETLDGRAYFIPLMRKPEAYAGKEKAPVAEGDFLTVKAPPSQRGRLAPVMFPRDLKQARREIKKGNIAGKLAEAVLNERAAPGPRKTMKQGTGQKRN